MVKSNLVGDLIAFTILLVMIMVFLVVASGKLSCDGDPSSRGLITKYMCEE